MFTKTVISLQIFAISQNECIKVSFFSLKNKLFNIGNNLYHEGTVKVSYRFSKSLVGKRKEKDFKLAIQFH